MSRRRKALYLFLGLSLVLGLLAAHMVAEVRRGEEIFWLAELWLPAAILSVGLVTGIEFLMPPTHREALAPHPAPSLPTPPVKAPRSPRASKAAKTPASPRPTRSRKTSKN
jgi:hypothetical protein